MAERTFGGFDTYEEWLRATADSLGKPSDEASLAVAQLMLANAERTRDDQGPTGRPGVQPS